MCAEPSDLVQIVSSIVHIYIPLISYTIENWWMAFGQRSTYRIYNKLLILITFLGLRDKVCFEFFSHADSGRGCFSSVAFCEHVAEFSWRFIPMSLVAGAFIMRSNSERISFFNQIHHICCAVISWNHSFAIRHYNCVNGIQTLNEWKCRWI